MERVRYSYADHTEKEYAKLKPTQEQEVSIYSYVDINNRTTPLDRESFDNVIQLINHSKKEKKETKEKNVKYSVMLDAIFNYDNSSYRVTMKKDINKIAEYLKTKKNNIIFSVMVKYSKKILMKKKESHQFINDFNMKLRRSEEIPLVETEIEKILQILKDPNTSDDITFRYKERLSLIVLNNDDVKIRIDATTARTNNIPRQLIYTYAIYEMEVEIKKKKETIKKEYIDLYNSTIAMVLKVIKNTEYLISNTEEDEVLRAYCTLVGADINRIKNLVVQQTVSVELRHAIHNLPNKRGVTDKADGERHNIFIYKGKIYLISNNLKVKYAGYDTKKEEYNGTIVDGEYIFVPDYNTNIVRSFNILFYKGKDVRKEKKLENRLSMMDDVQTKCLTLKWATEYKYKEFEGKYSSENIEKFYEEEMMAELEILTYNLEHKKKHKSKGVLISRKFYLLPTGANDNEVFKFSKLMWKVYVIKGKCKYRLDGMIYVLLNIKNIESLNISASNSGGEQIEELIEDLKWKPENKNTMDFYIKFEIDRKTLEIINWFDNHKKNTIRGKTYQICYLHVGKKEKGKEYPVFFMSKYNKHITYLPVVDGHARDKNGGIIQNNTVVEFAYDTNPETNENYRWIPLRTRYDKTESVQRYKRRYGNNNKVAARIWNSIITPFTLDDINILANDKNYKHHMKQLVKKIKHKTTKEEKKRDAYFEKHTEIAQSMRFFHGFLTSILITVYSSPIYNISHKDISVLDIGCGRGAHNTKYYHAGTTYYVGIDSNYNALFSNEDGALGRYKQLKQRIKHGLPQMKFVYLDFGVPLTVKNQEKVINDMDETNKKLITQIFDRKDHMVFDRITCHFALHYFLSNDTNWGNFCDNINIYLKNNGVVILTTFDGTKVLDLLDNKDKYTEWYTDDSGDKKKLFEITKQFELSKKDSPIFGTGNCILFYFASFMKENKPIPEYLVHPKFLENELKEKCNLKLIESESFEKIYNIHKEYFKNVAPMEKDPRHHRNLNNIATYYDMSNGMNKSSFQLTKLYRYYIFIRSKPIK